MNSPENSNKDRDWSVVLKDGVAKTNEPVSSATASTGANF